MIFADIKFPSQKYIRHMDEFLDCALDFVEVECGAGAAEYRKTIVQLSAGPILEWLGCGQ